MNRFVAPILGGLHHRDVPTRLLESGEFEALVVGPEGGVVCTTVRTTELWQARAWVGALACPRCSGAARVLRLNQGQLVCGRCSPPRSSAARLSRYQRRVVSGLEQQVVRAALEGEGVDQLRRMSAVIADHAEERARALCLAAEDLVLVARIASNRG